MRFTKSIKFRLTVLNVTVLISLLIISGWIAYLMLSRNLYQNLDDSLKLGAAQLVTSLDADESNIGFDGDELNINEQPFEIALLYDDKGHLLWSWGQKDEISQVYELVNDAIGGDSLFTTSETTTGQEMRFYAASFTLDESGDYTVIVVGHSTADIRSVLQTFRWNLILASLAMAGVAAAVGVFLTKRALKPVEKITEAAQEIEESDLSRRIEVQSEDELGRLAIVLNQMISRLEGAFKRQRQLTADASHELRTPLAVIQASSTLALRKKRTGSDYRKALESISIEATHMSTMVESLLFLARSDSGNKRLNLDKVNLSDLLTGLVSELELLFKGKGLQFRFEALQNLIVRGDRIELKRLFLNLLDNAVKYTLVGGIVSVSAVKKGDNALVAITDSGIGISQEHIPHIFERFYRVDAARSTDNEGMGLGLSICNQIVQLHGGHIEVESQLGKGSTFSVSLPLFSKS